MASTGAGRLLARQLQQMKSDKDIPGISCGLVDNNVFEWEVILMISDDTPFYGGGCKSMSTSKVHRLTTDRWHLSSAAVVPRELSTHAAEDEV